MENIYMSNDMEIIENYNQYKNEGVVIKEIQDRSILDDIINKVKNHFTKSTKTYMKMSRNQFHDFVIECQYEINKLDIQKRFYESEKKLISLITSNDEVLHESVVFLRVVRPKVEKNPEENPDFHRETFYSDDHHTPYVINIWIPIMNVNENNTLQYVPESHLIPDDDIEVEIDETWPGKVDKFSSGHKMGSIYVASAKSKSVITVAGFALTKITRYPSSFSALTAWVPE